MDLETKEATESLPCILTDTEVMEVSRALARCHQEVTALKSSKAEFDSQVNASIKKAAAEIESCSLKISTGRELRPVKCVWEYDWTSGQKTLRRLDTEAIVKVIAISDEERQEGLMG